MDVKKGTTTVGIVCKDGIVLAADRRATAGNLIVDKRAEKVHVVTDYLAVTIAGAVADAQLLIKILRGETKLKQIREGHQPSIKEVANLLGGLLYSNVRRFSAVPGITHFLLGGRDDKGMHLYDLFPDGSITNIDDYISSGSGSVFALGVLETLYKKDMSVDEGIKLALRAVNAALQRDSYSGNGVDIAVVSTKSVEKLPGQAIEAKLKI